MSDLGICQQLVTYYIGILKELNICLGTNTTHPGDSKRHRSYTTASLNEHIGFFN